MPSKKANLGEPLLSGNSYLADLRNRANLLIRNPIPGDSGANAAPTFEIAQVAGQVRS